MDRTPALVMGLNPNGLGLVKSLVREEVPVVAVDHRPESWRDTHVWMSSRTRLCSKLLLPPGADEETMVDAMVEWASGFEGRIPVLPSSDSFLYSLSRYRERLEPHFSFLIPDEATLELLMKKGQFSSFCLEEGIPAPNTICDVTLEVAKEVGEGLTYPCLVKPEYRGDLWSERFGNEKALEAFTPTELVECVRRASSTGEGLMIQEIIPGPDSNLFFTHGFLSSESEVMGMWTGRKLRQYPAGYGTSTLVETIHVPELADLTSQIARTLGLRGYVSIEFKFDPRDESYRILEVTPGRSWYPHYLGTTVGVNLPYIWYLDLLGQKPDTPVPGVPPDGIAWVDEYRDLVAAFLEWRSGRLGLGSWLRSYSPVRSFALSSIRDPLPAAFVGARLMIAVVKRLIPRGEEAD